MTNDTIQNDGQAVAASELSLQTSSVQAAARGIKLVAELVLPGASLLADGKIAQGGAHVVAGIAARALLGPIGFILVAANSYTRSVTGKHIHELVGQSVGGLGHGERSAH